MKVLQYLSENRINLNLKGTNKSEILEEMAKLYLEDGTISEEDFSEFLFEVNDRENMCSTGMQEGIAIPHVKSELIKKMMLAFGVSKTGVDFESMDGEPSKVFFLIVAPRGTKKEHLDLLAEISKLTYDDEIIKNLENAKSGKEVIELLEKFKDEMEFDEE